MVSVNALRRGGNVRGHACVKGCLPAPLLAHAVVRLCLRRGTNRFCPASALTPVTNGRHLARTMPTPNLHGVGMGVRLPCIVESQPVGARNLLGLRVDDDS